jgi:hypothetical protein
MILFGTMFSSLYTCPRENNYTIINYLFRGKKILYPHAVLKNCHIPPNSKSNSKSAARIENDNPDWQAVASQLAINIYTLKTHGIIAAMNEKNNKIKGG